MVGHLDGVRKVDFFASPSVGFSWAKLKPLTQQSISGLITASPTAEISLTHIADFPFQLLLSSPSLRVFTTQASTMVPVTVDYPPSAYTNLTKMSLSAETVARHASIWAMLSGPSHPGLSALEDLRLSYSMVGNRIELCAFSLSHPSFERADSLQYSPK
jgi:hypothetical protein